MRILLKVYDRYIILTGYPQAERGFSYILTQLAYIANGKKSCSVLQQFTGRKCVTLFGAVNNNNFISRG